MSYAYPKVDDLQDSPLVGSHQCVALIRHYTTAPATLAWRKGNDVVGNLALVKGTAIATFVDGKYPNHGHGNHAAFYLGQGPGGIYIMDQWKNENKEKVSRRFIKSRGKDKNGKFIQPSDNADAFSIIE